MSIVTLAGGEATIGAGTDKTMTDQIQTEGAGNYYVGSGGNLTLTAPGATDTATT